MEINKEVTVKLTPKEVEKIIIEHLKYNIGVDVKTVLFNVNGHESVDDWRGELSLDYRLDEVICRGLKYENNKLDC
jgi:hypothetical protein